MPAPRTSWASPLCLCLLVLSIPASIGESATDTGCNLDVDCEESSSLCVEGECTQYSEAVECLMNLHCSDSLSQKEGEDVCNLDTGKCTKSTGGFRTRDCLYNQHCKMYSPYESNRVCSSKEDCYTSDEDVDVIDTIECMHNGHCDGSEVCVDGKCEDEGNGVECWHNHHCGYAAPFCNEGTCTTQGPGVQCLYNYHCPEHGTPAGTRSDKEKGEYTASGLCIEGECSSEMDIEGHWECESSRFCGYYSWNYSPISERISKNFCIDRKCTFPDIPGALQCAWDIHCPISTPFCMDGRCSAEGPGTQCLRNWHCEYHTQGTLTYCLDGVCGDTGPGIECLRDSHCKRGFEFCNAEGSCEYLERRSLGAECTFNGHCDPGLFCVDSSCEADGPGVECLFTDHCGVFEACVVNKCEVVPGQSCADSEDCHPSYNCTGGVCERACPDGSVPEADACVAKEACDLAQACGSGSGSCGARQSTFLQYDADAVALATDGDTSSCMVTADATEDEQPQWVRVDLEAHRLVGTVRVATSTAATAADVKVLVAGKDAALVVDDAGTPLGNPSHGGALPELTEACAVAATGEAGVLEASCPPATKSRFVFVLAAAAQEVLTVCEVEAFEHACLAQGAAPECGLGYHPSACERCAGCVPCPAGFYSDKEGDYPCTPCPGSPQPYSPPGSTSEFQCEGDAVLDGTSTLEVEQVAFEESIDAWLIDIAVEQAPKIQINGLSALYISSGGDNVVSDTFTASQFPCRADESEAEGSDLSVSLSETVCCLQDMRQDYLMTKIFRDFTDGLDLVAANDECDAEDGSSLLVNADLEVWGEGTVFVDTAGDTFAKPITIEPIEAPPSARRANPEGYAQKQYARITIPDAELYKISRHGPAPHQALPGDADDTTYLTDQRELFVGLLDMLPTGTRVVDSASQQIAIKLTRTQYGAFAAYGEQNIDYDFISYLNARAHKVLNRDFDGSAWAMSSSPAEYYLEVTYVYDDRLTPKEVSTPVELLSSVSLTMDGDNSSPCVGPLPPFYTSVVDDQEDCGPTELGFAASTCPQVSLPDDKFGRIYIPLPEEPQGDVVSVSFELSFTDGTNEAALEVSLDVVVADFVSWCGADSGSVDLAERVIPAITIGTESKNPPRLSGFDADTPDFSTGAETLQDGLITLELSLNETDGRDDNLEVFLEDVLVIQINPGSPVVTIDEFQPGSSGDYIPTYTYDPDSRDATLNIPDALKEQCPEAMFSESFFGCVHKHVLAEEEVTNAEWAYLVGSSGDVASTGAQDFMETMLGSGTAAVAARELGRDYEDFLVGDMNFATRKKIGLWINPGHEWGQTVHNSEYSLSQHVVMYVLFGVRSGVSGTERRMLLQASRDGRTSLLQSVSYEVTAAELVENVLGAGVAATEVRAAVSIPHADACKPQAEQLAWCAETPPRSRRCSASLWRSGTPTAAARAAPRPPRPRWWRP